MLVPGLLSINLDPTCITFLSDCGKLSVLNCTQTELKQLLHDLDFDMSEHWPPCEYVVRIRGEFDAKALTVAGLVEDMAQPSNAA